MSIENSNDDKHLTFSESDIGTSLRIQSKGEEQSINVLFEDGCAMKIASMSSIVVTIQIGQFIEFHCSHGYVASLRGL